MRLTELEPEFVRYVERVEPKDFAIGDHTTWAARGFPTERRVVTTHYLHPVETLAEAQGITFLCPKCFIANKGSIGTHKCEVSFEGRGVKPEQGTHNDQGQPVRWHVSGTDFGNLTTTPSILLIGGCAWHGWITNGEVT